MNTLPASLVSVALFSFMIRQLRESSTGSEYGKMAHGWHSMGVSTRLAQRGGQQEKRRKGTVRYRYEEVLSKGEKTVC
jgi:hypothetical protein